MFRALAASLLALCLVAPAFAAPVVTAKVSHNCCGQCDNSITALKSKIPWAGELKSDRKNLAVSLTPTATGKVDLTEMLAAFQKGGFPLQSVKVEGVKTIEFSAGHLCCEGCAGPLREALAGVKTLTGVTVESNKPVKATIAGGVLDVSALMKTLDAAGYSAVTMIVQ